MSDSDKFYSIELAARLWVGGVSGGGLVCIFNCDKKEWNGKIIEFIVPPPRPAEHCECIKIVNHVISQTVSGQAPNFKHQHQQHPVRHANDSSSLASPHRFIQMDCDYVYDVNDIKLVVRWFYNDSPEPIYQWIPESDTRYISDSIQPYFDVHHKISDDPFTRYRALRLVSNQERLDGSTRQAFPVSLSGNYTCVISSIMNQDSRQGSLTVYGELQLIKGNPS